MRKSREALRDSLGGVVLGGYPVRVYRTPVAALTEPLPPPDKRGLLLFDYDQGVMVLWEGGGLEFFDAEWVKTYVVVDR